MAAAQEAVEAVLRFINVKGWSTYAPEAPACETAILSESCLNSILSAKGGLLLRYAEPGDGVAEGQLLGKLIDPCSGLTVEELHAVCSCKLFFAHKAHLISGHDVAFRILPE